MNLRLMYVRVVKMNLRDKVLRILLQASYVCAA